MDEMTIQLLLILIIIALAISLIYRVKKALAEKNKKETMKKWLRLKPL